MEWFLLLAGLCQVVALRTDDVYHYKEEEGKMVEWLVERASLPISGNFEFFGSSKHTGMLYLLRIEDKATGMRIISCVFWNLFDDEWHSMNWTLHKNQLGCQIDRSETYSEESFDDKVKTLSIRFDASNVCIRNMTIKDQYLSGCSKSTIEKFTSTAAVCGCPEAQQSTKPPGKELADKTVYHFSTEENTKVEWKVDNKEQAFFITGSYEYLSAAPSLIHSNYTYNLAIIDRDSGQTLTMCTSNDMSDGENWLSFKWTLYENSVYCDYGNILQSERIEWIRKKAVKRFSLRLDTDRSPSAIRNLVLRDKHTVSGCPPVVPRAVKNVNFSGLFCDDTEPVSGKTTIPPGGESPLEEKGTIYHYSKRAADKVEWKIDGSKLNDPISGSYEYINAPPDAYNRTWTYYLVVYNSETEEMVANCSTNTTASRSQQWFPFTWMFYQNSLSCFYYSAVTAGGAEAAPYAIRNLVLNGEMPVAGCPPAGPASIKNFTTAGLLCGEPEPDVYHFSKDKSTMVEWRIDTSVMIMPVFGRYEYTRDPNSDQTINLEVYDIDSRALLINCTTNDTAKEWKYFGFILYTQAIVCCYDTGCNVLGIENTVMQPRFSIRFVTGKRPTGIRNLILNKNYTINGCPPAVTPALQNFTVSALLCGEPEPSDNGKTTIPPGGNSPLEEEEVENVYIFSTEKNNKVEWKIDTSATSMPVYGAHEFISAPSFFSANSETTNLEVYDGNTGALLANCSSDYISKGKKWQTFSFYLYTDMIYCCYESGSMCHNEWIYAGKIPKFSVRLDTRRRPAAIKNLKILDDDYTITGCPPVVPSAVQKFTTSGLSCNETQPFDARQTTKSAAGKTTKTPGGGIMTIPPVVKSPLDKDATVYRYSSERNTILEWRVDFATHNGQIAVGRYEYLAAPPNPNYENETYNLVIYDTDSGKQLATCSSGEQAHGGQKWLQFSWILYNNIVYCTYPSGYFSKDIKSSDVPKFTLRLDIGPRPTAIKNLNFDEMLTVTGCPPGVPLSSLNITISGLLCDGGNPSGTPSNTMQPPRGTKPTPPTPIIEQLPPQEIIDEWEREEDERFFQKIAPYAGIGLGIGQGLIALIH